MAFDMARLTMGEIALIEDLSGERYVTMLEGGFPSGKGLAAIAMVAKRREQLANGQAPNFSWNQAQDLEFPEAMKLINPETEEVDEGPKELPSKPSKTSKASVKKA